MNPFHLDALDQTAAGNLNAAGVYAAAVSRFLQGATAGSMPNIAAACSIASLRRSPPPAVRWTSAIQVRSSRSSRMRLDASTSCWKAEWGSDRSFSERVANLRGEGSGSTWEARRNGAYFLTMDGPTASVFDDAVSDIVTGSAGQDWFFGNLDSVAQDRITDLSASEFAADLDFVDGP